MPDRVNVSNRLLHLFLKYDGRCHYCARKVFLFGDMTHPLVATQDHKHPLAKGGARKSERNIVLACMQCNNIKDDVHYEDFMASLAIHGGIFGVTEAVYDERRALRWERAATKPIPHQKSIVWPIKYEKTETTLGAALRDAVKIEVRPRVASRPKELFFVCVYSLIEHKITDSAHVYQEKRARLIAQQLASKNGDLRWSVCWIQGEGAIRQYLYERDGWRWTPYELVDKAQKETAPTGAASTIPYKAH